MAIDTNTKSENKKQLIMVNLDEMMGKVTSFIHEEANTSTVVGKEFVLGNFTCVPVIRVGLGFGSGGGEGKDMKKGGGEGGGAGGAMGLEPIGFLVANGDDIQFIGANNSKGLGNVMDKVPDVMSKYFDMKKAESN